MRRFIINLLFIGYTIAAAVFIYNLYLNGASAPYSNTIAVVGLSFLGGVILFCDEFLSAVFGPKKGKNKIIWQNLIFSLVFLFLALINIWRYTILATVQIDFLPIATSPLNIEVIFALTAGIIFAKSFK